MPIWVVIIAVENYPNLSNEWDRTLPGTNKAAEDFRKWAMTVKNVPASNIIACTDDSLAWKTTGNTRNEIEDAFTALVKQARNKAEELYVFFSGHGIGYEDDTNEPPIDLVLGSEFDDPSTRTGGASCLRVSELREKLRAALGLNGLHFYFIDACRNTCDRRTINPAVLTTPWANATSGRPTTFELFSTAPGDVAKVNSGFSTALISGLNGRARAKTWVGGKMYVTFDKLCDHVHQALNRDDLNPRMVGPKATKGNIVELDPIPQSKCTVEVVGAAPTDEFTLDAADVRKTPRDAIKFAGPQTIASFVPEDYLFQLRTAAGAGVPQIDPAPDHSVDLYEDRTVQFQMGTAADAKPPPASDPSPSPIDISAPAGARVVLENLTRGTSRTLKMREPTVTTRLQPGHYQLNVRDGNFNLRWARFIVSPGEPHGIDLSPRPITGAHTSIADALPNDGMAIQFSETLGELWDWDLSLWLALLGGSRILAPRNTFTKLQSFELETFGNARRDKSVLYVLAGERKGAAAPRCMVGSGSSAKPMQPVPDLPGLFQMKLEFEPGQLLVTYAAGTTSTTIVTHGLPNRATLLTVARDEKGRQRIQQFILPIYALSDQLSARERNYLQRKRPKLLQLLRYMSTAQRLFERQALIKENAQREGDDDYWLDLLFGKWLDPVMALIACYELIRRGRAARERDAMREVLGNMRRYFPGFADTEVIAKLVNEPHQMPAHPPMLMDGVLALGPDVSLPQGAERLDYDGIWTSWRTTIGRKVEVGV